jgi:hypothetical protein
VDARLFDELRDRRDPSFQAGQSLIFACVFRFKAQSLPGEPPPDSML